MGKYIKLFEDFNSSANKGYHISPIKNREVIKVDGLKSNTPKRYHLKGIYFWGHKDLAIWYALSEMRDTDNEFDIWEIDLKGLSEDHIIEDESIGIDFSYYTNEDIHPSKLKLIDTISLNDTRINLLDTRYDLDNILMDIED